jgi:hypothetical protein
MTKEQIDSLSPEIKRVKIAELLGWTFEKYNIKNPSGERQTRLTGLGRDRDHEAYKDAKEIIAAGLIPDYLNSLDAIVAAVRQLVTEKVPQANFAENLTQIINRKLDGQHRFLGATPFHIATAEPDDLASALLMTMLP